MEQVLYLWGAHLLLLGDGSSGMYWNPAGLADVKNGQVYLESYNYVL